MAEFYDTDGSPLTMMEWSAKSELKRTEDYGRVGSDEVSLDGVAVWVSTVWLGIDMGHGLVGVPIIFETAIFAMGGRVEIIDRYATWDAAADGHRWVVERLRSGKELGRLRELES